MNRVVCHVNAALLLTLVFAAFRLSGAAPAVTVKKDIPYRRDFGLTEYEGQRCKLDLYLPQSGTGFATLIWFHGGALKNGSKDEEFSVRIGQALAGSGLAVAMANYRLSPRAVYPAYIEDAAAAVAWVRASIGQHGGDSRRLHVGGHSAGAYLALMLGLDGRYLEKHGFGTDAIAGLIPVSGQTMTHYTVREERGLPKDTIIADAAAPVHHVRRDAPPMLLIVADNDLPARVEENQLLLAALRAAGHRSSTLRSVADRDHGSIAGNIAVPGDPAAQAILSFVNSR